MSEWVYKKTKGTHEFMKKDEIEGGGGNRNSQQ